MESPLNVAHHYARMADKLQKQGEDASEVEANHKRAAENILLALEMSTSVHARESLQLQHAYHTKQRDRFGLTAAKQKHQTASREIDEGGCDVMKPLTTDGGSLNDDISFIPNSDDDRVYKSMADTKSLLFFLNSQPLESWTPKNLDRFLSSGQEATANESLMKRRDERAMLDVMTADNEDLRSHVMTLIHELAASRERNSQLREQLDRCETNKTLLLDNADPSPAIQLPPLEMPNFDFESLKTELDNVDRNGET